jgi:hypothetical protein
LRPQLDPDDLVAIRMAPTAAIARSLKTLIRG